MTTISFWHMNNIHRAVRLYQSPDLQYFVTEDGAWSPILHCPLFTIVNQELLFFFKQHAYPVESHPVKIIDRVLNQTFDGYHRIYIKDEITPSTYANIDTTGFKLWRFQGAVFVSNSVKELLEETRIEGICFTPGFSMWG